MIFQKRQDFTPQQTVVLSGTNTFELSRTFHIESIFIQVTFTPTAMATDNADGITNLLQRVQVGISDGAQNRNAVDVTGQGLLEWNKSILGKLDRVTDNIFRGDPGTTTTTLTYPVWFAHPQLSDPVGSLFLLPAPRFNSNPVVTLQWASQAQMDTHATPTFTITDASVRLIVNRRQVTRGNFPTYNTELAEIQQAYPTTGNAQNYELQIPGSYTGLLIRDYQSATARGSIQTAGGENRLELMGTVMRRFRTGDVQIENDLSQTTYLGTGAPINMVGAFYLDFLSDKVGTVAGDLGSVLDTNIAQASGARVNLLQDITGGAAVRRSYFTHRIYGDLSALKF